MVKFGTNSVDITWWSNFELIRVNHIQLAKFGTKESGILFSWRDNSSYRLYTLGPLCLWQCFFKISGFMVVNTHAVFSQEKTLTFFLCSLYKSCFIKCQEEKVLMGNFLMAETLSSDETRANIGKFGIKLTNTPEISNELLSLRSAFRSQ